MSKVIAKKVKSSDPIFPRRALLHLQKRGPKWLLYEVVDAVWNAFERGKLEGGRLVHRSYGKRR